MIRTIKENKYIGSKTDCFFAATPCTVTESYYIDNGKLMYSKYSKTTNGTAVCHENYECDKQIKIEF